MGRSSRKDAELTRDHILATAATLFALKGVSEVPLTLIAKHARLTTGAVYWHFENKSELLIALFERAYCPIADLVREFQVIENTGNEAHCLEEFCLRLFDEIVGDPQNLRFFGILLTHMELTAANVLTPRFQSATHDLRGALHYGVSSIYSESEGRSQSDIDRAAMFLMIQLIGGLRYALIEGASEYSLNIARSCIQMAVAAVGRGCAIKNGSM
ncbi:MAG TPA: TetR family transcriptional regulator [Paraburkholderia sp.]|uniref:TetR family transcriptional regulator n=1 Tax=Paraburkholderia sp. TaxID=1926495 RepID=UPI002B4A4BFC|nr:TetR family transcriptional regulator [Paraburkholderia sp.]HKR39388.1 TetR family transcriptional regulator [Paraburkholderia sp.]